MKYFKIAVLLTCFSIGFGQFGKNIVQYDEFNWKYIQSSHFDIYYYDPGLAHAEFVASEAEKAYLHIADLIGWRLKNRVAIIVYNSHNDFQQTNVVSSYMVEGIGGVTELFKNRVVIPFDGSQKEFRHVIHHELVHAFINDGVYGGNYNAMVQNPNRVMIPGWMNEGLAEYLATRWDTNSDMWLRDLTINGREIPSIQLLNGYLAYRGGQSVWKFITQKWGEESIAEIFYRIKESRSIEKGFKRALSIDLETLNEQWQQYLKEVYWPDISFRRHIADEFQQLTDHVKLENSYNIAPAISPNGSQIAMFSNKSGTMGLYLISAEDGHFIKQIIKGERNGEFEELHILKPGITWSPDNKHIAFAAKSGKSDALFIVNCNNGDKQKYRFEMEGIFRPTWNPIKNEIAFIGNDGMASDIYIFEVDTKSLTNITNDVFSDDQVSWHPNGNSLIFISDREDVLHIGMKRLPNNHNPDQIDIYTLNIETNNMNRISKTDFTESYPCYSSDGETIAYIYDETGVKNIYLLHNGKSQPITNTITGITQLSWNGDDSQLIFTGFYKSGYDIFTLSNPLEKLNNDIKIENSKWISEGEMPSILREEKVKPQIETNQYKNYVFDRFAQNDKPKKEEIVELDKSSFTDSTGSFISRTYKTKFSLDLAQAMLSFDSNYGGQGMGYFMFSDMLGNHRILLATEMEVNFKTSDYLIRYQFLPNKTDWDVSLYHYAYEYLSSNALYLYQNLGTDIKLQRPFSKFHRIEGGLEVNHLSTNVFTAIDEEGNLYEDPNLAESINVTIPSIKYIWDNTLWSYMYPVSGFRIYAKQKIAPKMGNDGLSFQSFTFDARKYASLGNGISLAGRIFGGKSWGDDPRQFRLGGTPWIFSNNSSLIASNVSNDESVDLFLSEYVMPLRGYQIASKLGEHVALVNLELRLPFLLYYFPTIKYLGQINGVFFTDFGVAWNDTYPEFWDETSWNENISEGWIMSYGFGPRFIFLGLPWQLDYAWQYNPHKGTISSRQWYLTIGLDF